MLPHFYRIYPFITAGGAAEALKTLSTNRIDAILVDYKMPEMDGIEFCCRVSSDSRTENIPITLMTGYDITDDIRFKGLESGAIDFLSKPFEAAEFAARIKVMLRIKANQDKLAEMNQNLETILLERTNELRNSEERFRDIFLHMSDGVAVYEAIDGCKDFVLLDINPAGCRISRLEREYLVGRSVKEAFPGIVEMGLFEVFQQVWKTGKPETLSNREYYEERLKIWLDKLRLQITWWRNRCGVQ